MATLLKNLLGSTEKEPELTDEIRTLLRELREERGLCETLVKSARASVKSMQELGEPIARTMGDVEAVSGRVGGLEERLSGLERLGERLQSLDERSEQLERSHRQVETRITHTDELAQRIRSSAEDLGQKVDLALDLKQRLGSFLALDAPFKQLIEEMDRARAQMDGTTEQLARLREQQERVMDAHKAAFSKIDAYDARQEELARALVDKEHRVARTEQALRGLEGVHQEIEETNRRLESLRGLGEYLVQRTSALEAQREVVERALARTNEVSHAMRELETAARQQQQHAKSFHALQEQLAGLQSLYASVAQRSKEADELQRQQEEGARAIRAELATAQDEARKSLERLDFEASGLESVSQRVGDLRGALSDFEGRFAGLADAKRTVDAMQSQGQSLSERLEHLSGDIAHLDAEAEKIRALRRELEAVTQTAREAGERVASLDQARPGIDATLRDFRQLHNVHLLLKDALDQARDASSELSRMRGEHSELHTWLTTVQQSLEEQRVRVEDLQSLAPTVEFVQAQAHRINESLAAIEARRDSVEEMHRRMAELGAVSAALDDRGHNLQGRMDAAEQRFVALGMQSEEAERLAKGIADVSSALRDAEHKTSDITKSIAGIQSRCESVEELAERTRVLRQEVEQRQRALDDAGKDLERASELRLEAAAAARDLDDIAKQLGAALASADQQVTRVSTITTELEDRATSLHAVETRLDDFEERLANWERVELQIADSLEGLLARQGTIESLQADVERMFAVSEKTADNMRAITSTHREIEDSRALLDSVMQQLKTLGDTASTLDERKRQMAQAEERLARAEAVLLDVRASLGSLQGQKVIIDQAVEKAGALHSLVRQAETMVERLREERDITARVQVAVAIDEEPPRGDQS